MFSQERLLREIALAMNNGLLKYSPCCMCRICHTRPLRVKARLHYIGDTLTVRRDTYIWASPRVGAHICAMIGINICKIPDLQWLNLWGATEAYSASCNTGGLRSGTAYDCMMSVALYSLIMTDEMYKAN